MKTATAAAVGLALVTTTDALSMQQVASLWKQNGGSSSSCPTAVAVAWAESRGNPKATGRNPGSYDRGLWQINSKWHPDVSDSCAYNAACNARNAVRISSGGTRWSPWATYNHGRHRQFMGQAKSACSSSRDEIEGALAIGTDDEYITANNGYITDDGRVIPNNGYVTDDGYITANGQVTYDNFNAASGYVTDDGNKSDCFETCRERGFGRKICRRKCKRGKKTMKKRKIKRSKSPVRGKKTGSLRGKFNAVW